MAEYIEKTDVLDSLSNLRDKSGNSEMAFALNWAIEIIRNKPAADVAKCDKWIPIKTRPMDNEERMEWSGRLGFDIEYNEAVVYVSQLPDDGQTVLTCGRYGTIRIDTFENDPDYGCSFEENGDMDGIVAWMPLPEPYKEEGGKNG